MVTELCQRDIDEWPENQNPGNYKPAGALKDAKYVLNGKDWRIDAFQLDVDTLEIWCNQCVGDTLGPGIMYGQRGIPAVLNFAGYEVSHPDCPSQLC